MPLNLNFKYKELIEIFEKQSPFKPEITIILGSGLGNFVKSIEVKKTFSTHELPGYPPSTITSHEGKIHFAEHSGKKLLIFQGRIHLYEGYKIWECILPVFISYRLNTKYLILTNAAGGVNKNFAPGDFMLAKSFNGLFIKNELTRLISVASLEGKNNFLNLPSSKLNSLIKKAAYEENIDLKEGVYWYIKGPSYETPAEINIVKKFKGDATGMSTVHEAVYAAYMGIETSAVSCITNLAAGISPKKLSHEEVTSTARQAEKKLENLIKHTVTLA
ncbi:MAG: purine-nucleoside phosphorylase [Ignavibacteria bacterium]